MIARGGYFLQWLDEKANAAAGAGQGFGLNDVSQPDNYASIMIWTQRDNVLELMPLILLFFGLLSFLINSFRQSADAASIAGGNFCGRYWICFDICCLIVFSVTAILLP
ncbi:hypothetical protein FHR87_003478 [Azomonas macrocytogenes]|uniref:Uncharacterized protein n=1 Tax=Azomonas macrocytogenes TaxID=69962 RepID=A0A839TA51_AZOMA|nr:hypothetical protein [Azomonas macrocytogenes]